MTIIIRDANAEDEPRWRELWRAYLHFYKVNIAPEVTDTTWKRILDPKSSIDMRVADVDGTIQGFAIYLRHPSTWVMNDDCYLEDLFVDENCRGQGLGRKLIDDLESLCRQNGWERLYWHTDEGNSRARALYDSYVSTDGHVRYRFRPDRHLKV